MKSILHSAVTVILICFFAIPLANAGGSTFGVTETNVRDKYLEAGESGQFLMSFSLDRAGTYQFNNLDITCIPSYGLKGLTLMQGDNEIDSTTFREPVGDGSQLAHFGENEYVIPSGPDVEFSLYVDVEEGTGDYISACTIYDLTLYNPEKDILYDSGYQAVDMSGIDRLVYVDDPAFDDRMENFNIFDSKLQPTNLGLDTKDNLLMDFSVNASEDIMIEDIFIYCQNASIIKDARLEVDSVLVGSGVTHTNWYVNPRPEFPWDKRFIFSSLGTVTGLGAGVHFKLYGDTYDYFSLMPGTVTDCSVIDIMATDEPETDENAGYNYAAGLETKGLYTDVDDDAPYRYAVGVLSDMGIIEGYADGMFKPDQSVNRAEFLKMVLLTSGYGERIAGVETSSGFSDVDSSAWYAKYIAFAKNKGIIKGYPDLTFKPDRAISRVEGLKIIMGEFFKGEEEYLSDYSHDDKLAITGCYDRLLKDVEAGSWYENYAFFAHDLCIIPREMADDHNLHPADALTRGETVELLLRARSSRDHDMEYSPGISPNRVYDECVHADESQVLGVDQCCPGLNASYDEDGELSTCEVRE